MKRSTMVAQLNSRILPLFLLMLLAFSGCAQHQKKQGPLAPAKPVFETTDIDVGTVFRKDSILERDIKVTNEGEKYFWIHDVANSCQCTTAEYPREEVKDGESITIKVKLNLTQIDPGPFQRDVDVYTNLSDKPYTISIHGELKLK